MPLRSRGYLLVLVAALAITPQETAAVDLEQTTVAAYDRYIETVAQAFSKQVGTDAFLAQASPQALDRLRHGEILLEPGGGDGSTVDGTSGRAYLILLLTRLRIEPLP